MSARLLIAGGSEDPQLARIVDQARRRGADLRLALMDGAAAPALIFDPATRALAWGGEPLEVDAAFVRQDAFRPMRTGDPADAAFAHGWKRAFDAFLLSRPEIRTFNRGFKPADAVNKAHALALAAELGLPTPQTRLHDDPARALADLEAGFAVMKPAAGGDLCRVVSEATLAALTGAGGKLAQPMLFQERLVAPELRIFRVGARFIAFEVASDALDYRDPSARAPRLTPVAAPDALLAPLTALLDRLGLDFAACDFKTRAQTGAQGQAGALCFLEANSNPMFAAFDQASAGALTGAMLDWLL